MKKANIFVSFIIIFSVLLTGCSSTSQNNSDKDAVNNLRRADFGQPERQPDMMGIVVSVLGNEVTILKVESQNPGEKNTENQDQNTEAPTLNTDTSIRTGMGGGSGGMRPQGGDESDIIEMMKQRATGEEKVMIPVGIRMLMPDISLENNEQYSKIEASLLDIKENKIISIWLNQDIIDRNIAEFVLIR